MRILIYGAGVIGSLYAVLLKEAGYDTTIYARGHRLEALQNQGLLYKKNNINSYYILEENGLNLSNGERKRLLIARSLLKRSNLIIFDESFNEIDVETERKILNNIFKNYPEKKIIMISHRLNNKDLFDKCYELRNKKLVLKEE